MALPIVPLGFVGFAGYAVLRAFREDRKHKSNAANGWRNEAFAKQEEARNRDKRKDDHKR